MPETLALNVLQSEFEIRSDSTAIIRFLERLWGAFRVDRVLAPRRIRIEPRGDLWDVQVEGAEEVVSVPDLWELADVVRRPLLTTSLLDTGPFVDLHSAVLDREGKGLLLVGGSRSGKTTLALELVDRGWTCFSDEVALLGDDVVKSFPMPLRIRDPERWDRWAAEWGPSVSAPTGAFQVPPQMPHLGTTTNPRWLAILAPLDEEDPAHGSLSVGEAAAACGRCVTDVGPDDVRVLVQLVRGVARTRLRGNLKARIERVDAFTKAT